MTSKERAKLKSIASKTDTILQIGKNPIGEAFLKQVSDALEARELIKIHVLETCELTPAEAASALADAADCQVVQVIGSKVILFRQRKKGDKRGSYLDNDKPSDKSGASTPKGREAEAKANSPKGKGAKNGAGYPRSGGYKTAAGSQKKGGYKTGAYRSYKGSTNKSAYGSGKRTGKK